MSESLEAELELDTTAEQVDLNDLYMIRLNKPRYISKELYKYIAKRTVAQALLQVINTNATGLILREIWPKYDLATYDDIRRIISNDWRQPPSTEWIQIDEIRRQIPNIPEADLPISSVPRLRTWDDVEVREGLTCRAIYTNGFVTHYNRKAMAIIGFQNLHPEEEVNTSAIIMRRGNVRLIGIDDMQSINNRGVIFFHKPWLVKAADEIRIDFELKQDAIGKRKHDQLQVLGMVCETAGANLT